MVTEVSVHLSEVEMTTNMALDVRSGHTKALLTSVHLAVERVTNSALPLIISGHTLTSSPGLASSPLAGFWFSPVSLLRYFSSVKPGVNDL